MKNLSHVTEEQVRKICELTGEPFISFMTNERGQWDSTGLEIQINTTSTMNGHRDDSYIWIRKNGEVQLWRNNGGWGGSRYESINGLAVTDYLRNQGYEFNY
jgi:hypothetical protein